MKVYLVLMILLFEVFSLIGQKRCLKNNCINGLGACEFIGKGKYSGYFKEGLPHGQGKYLYSNGDKYLGGWISGKRDGIGKFIYQNGAYYEGEFKEDFFEGEGTMQLKDQSRYEGEWKRGRRHGEGTLFLANGEKIAGNWQNGQLVADWSNLAFTGIEGALKNCNTYHCDAIQGKYQYQDGKRFLGDFQNGVPRGVGTVYYPNGDLYEGFWQSNRPNGKGTMYYAKGEAVGAIWENGNMKRKLFTKSHQGGVSAAAKHVKIWAVIVGAAQYENIHQLEYTDDDAMKIYDFLVSPNGGSLPTHQIELLLDQAVTKSKVLEAVHRIYLQADQNDVILFYFSGHGIKDAFLPIDSDGLFERIEHKDIRRFINLSKAKHKLIIADACHAGTFSYNSGSLAGFLRKYYDAFEASSGGIALLMSSRGDEFSYEDQRFGSGIFSYFLIEALRGAADQDDNGIITLAEAFEYVNKKVTHFTAGAQTPTLSGAYDEDMPVAIVKK